MDFRFPPPYKGEGTGWISGLLPLQGGGNWMDFRFPPLINGRELDGFPVSPLYKGGLRGVIRLVHTVALTKGGRIKRIFT
jgi:hypothetical protein